jgi:ParB family chromosome partitioning protein
LARPDFRAAAARRLAEDRELSPAVINLISSDAVGRATGVRMVPVANIEPNPEQPRVIFDTVSLDELAASIREHGVLQPILVRPLGANRYQLVAGERRWRASQAAGLETLPALVENIDDDTALEISIIENLQREDLSPLEEATMYDRMIREHGYSVRRLATKLGKDKGYVENRLRLADAPDEIKALVSVRKDTLSHAYELLKVDNPRRRRRLAEQVASGELSLVKLRDRIEGRRSRPARPTEAHEDRQVEGGADLALTGVPAEEGWTGQVRRDLAGEDALISAKHAFADALEELVDVLARAERDDIAEVDRANLAKYLTIAKIRLENAIALVRSGGTRA